MDDAELARKLHRAPSLSPAHLRGVLAFYHVIAEEPGLTPAEELAALELVARRARETAAAIRALGWYGAGEFQAAMMPMPAGVASNALEEMALAAETARRALAGRATPGRPSSRLTQVICHLADLIEQAGGTADATQGGELVQAFGVAVEALGLAVGNHREQVRGALKYRAARQ